MKLYDWDGLCIQVVVFCTRTDVVFAQDGGRDRKVRGGMAGVVWCSRESEKFNVSIGGIVCCLRQVLICVDLCVSVEKKRKHRATPTNNELHGQILGRRERRT